MSLIRHLSVCAKDFSLKLLRPNSILFHMQHSSKVGTTSQSHMIKKAEMPVFWYKTLRNILRWADCFELESELVTEDMSAENHSPRPVIRRASLYKRSKLSNGTLALSEAEIRKFVRKWQSSIEWGRNWTCSCLLLVVLFAFFLTRYIAVVSICLDVILALWPPATGVDRKLVQAPPPPVISLLAVPKLLFCFDSLVMLDVAHCYFWLFSL